MADRKWTELAENTTVQGTDLLCVVDDPSGTPASQKATVQNVVQSVAPKAHNNTAHSETYITAAGVTRDALNANGDVGTGADQVATGDHTHTVGSTHQTMFYWYGDAEVGEHEASVVNHFGAEATIIGVYLHTKTGKGPTGAAVIADVYVDGTTIFTTLANRPQIADGQIAGNSTTIEAPAWADGAELTAHLDQVGSTAPGTGVCMEIVFTIGITSAPGGNEPDSAQYVPIILL